MKIPKIEEIESALKELIKKNSCIEERVSTNPNVYKLSIDGNTSFYGEQMHKQLHKEILKQVNYGK